MLVSLAIWGIQEDLICLTFGLNVLSITHWLAPKIFTAQSIVEVSQFMYNERGMTNG